MKTQTAEITKTAALLRAGGLPGYLALAGGGVVVGLFSGLFGVGGGILMVPFLALVVGYTQQQAQGLSLTAMVVTAAASAFGYIRGGTVTAAMVPVAAALAIGSIPGGIAGSYVAQRLDKTQLERAIRDLHRPDGGAHDAAGRGEGLAPPLLRRTWLAAGAGGRARAGGRGADAV